MSRLMQHLARVLALVFFFFILAGGVRDANADTAAAQALFDAAKQLMIQGKYAEACPKLEESQRLDPGIGTQFNLATCYEQLGRTASAWSTFLEVAGAAKAAGQADREKVARQRATALEPKLVRMNITASESAPADLQVKRDGVLLGRAQLGTPVPVDPGKHRVEATAQGRKPFSTTIDITASSKTETVAIPELAPGPPVPMPTYPGTPPVAGGGMYLLPPQPFSPPQTRRRSRGMMAGGIVLISLGALCATVGSLIAVACSDGGCTQTSTDINGDYYSSTDSDTEDTGIGLMLGGLVGIGGGIALTVIGAKKVPVTPPASTSAAAPELLIGPGFTGLRWTM